MSCYDNLLRNGRARFVASSLLLCYGLAGFEFAWAQTPAPKTTAAPANAAKAVAKPAASAVQSPQLAPIGSQTPVWTPNPNGMPQPQGAALPPGGVPYAPGNVPAGTAQTQKSPPVARKPLPPPPSATPAIERFPLVADLEKLMFGTSHTSVPLEFRLDRLESHVFQRTFPNLDSNTRVNQLRETLIGSGDPLTSPATQPYIPAPQPKIGKAPPPSPVPQTAPPRQMQPQYGGAPPQYGAGPGQNAPQYTQAPPTAPPMSGGLQYGQGPQYNPQFGRPTSPPYGAPQQQQAVAPPSAQPPLDPAAVQPYIPNSMDGLYQDAEQRQPDPQQQNTPQPLPQLRFVDSPEFQKEMSREQLEKFAMEVINEVRANLNYAPFKWDPEAHKVGNELLADLAKNYSISHHNSKAENPDVRYTKAGGNDAMLESLTALSATGKPVFNKALVVKLIDSLYQKQDDRDALLSPNATQFSFSLEWSPNQKKLLACAEVVTKRAEVASVPREASVGDKIEVKGILHEPYKFVRISVAWEGIMPAAPEPADDSNEAMPYFPPLDYEAYARKAEHDWSKRTRMLQMAGITLAIAGGVFMPPVALAAPLIAAAGSNMSAKPVSEIPIRGGVDVDGQTFSHKVPLDNDDKEGIYYVTVWASNGVDPAPIAVSRRAIIVHADQRADGKKKKKKGEDDAIETTAGSDATPADAKTDNAVNPDNAVQKTDNTPPKGEPVKSADNAKSEDVPQKQDETVKKQDNEIKAEQVDAALKPDEAALQSENAIRQPDGATTNPSLQAQDAQPAPVEKETPKNDDPVQAFDEAVRK